MLVPDFKDRGGNWVTQCSEGGKHVATVSWNRWSAICNRCKVGGSLQRDYPAYVGCTNKFSSFNNFVEWYRKQLGYGLREYEVDKDFLFLDNKEYSEERCALVPKPLNLFFGKSTRSRGEYPQGTDMNYSNPGKWRAQIRVGGKTEHLGYFFSKEQAMDVYAKAKTAAARRFATEYEGKVDPRIISALATRTFTYRGLDLIFE